MKVNIQEKNLDGCYLCESNATYNNQVVRSKINRKLEVKDFFLFRLLGDDIYYIKDFKVVQPIPDDDLLRHFRAHKKKVAEEAKVSDSFIAIAFNPNGEDLTLVEMREVDGEKEIKSINGFWVKPNTKSKVVYKRMTPELQEVYNRYLILMQQVEETRDRLVTM